MKTVEVRDLETRHLQALDAIVTTGTFGRAAQHLGYTQSAVSQQIAALERAVGGAVFDRTGGSRRAALTPLGQVLAEQGALVLAEVEHAVAALHRFHDGASGHLGIGTFQSVSSTVLPEVLIALREHATDVSLRVVEQDDLAAFTDQLLEGRLDLAFVVSTPGKELDEALEGVELFADPFCVVARPQDVGAGAVPAAQLRQSPLIGEQQSACQRLLDDQLAAAGVPANYVLRASDNSAVTALVGAGLGMAVRALLTVDTNDPRIVVREMDPPLPGRTISLAWPKGRTLSPLAARAVQIAIAITAPRRQARPEEPAPAHKAASQSPTSSTQTPTAAHTR